MALKDILSNTNSYYYVQNVAYEAAGRDTLRKLGAPDLPSSPQVQTTYTYYPWNSQYQGGRLNQIQTGAYPNYMPTLQNLTYTYDEVGNVKTILDGANSNGALRFSVGPAAFAGGYDANGNMTHRLVGGAGRS